MNKIKFYRKLINITQEDLAKKVGCTLRTIQNIENGQTKPNIELGIKIQEALKVKDLKDLFNI